MITASLPLVSIVVPTYNHAAFLPRAVNSILSQDYQHVELIVINDGSTDDTEVVLNSLPGAFHRERQANMGQAATLNKGWSIANGSILGYLSADDVLLPYAVRTLVQALLSDSAAVQAYCDYNLIDTGNRIIRKISAPEYSYVDMVARVRCPTGPGALFRRSAFDAAGPWSPSLRLVPDYEFWLRLGLQGPFLHVTETLASFQVHRDSQSYSLVDAHTSDEYIRVLERFFERGNLPKQVLDVKKRALSNGHLIAAQSHLRSHRYGEALRRVSAALHLYPPNANARTLKLLLRVPLQAARYRDLRRRVDSRSAP